MSPRETVALRKDRAADCLERLEQRYPDARCELNFESPFQLLIATILAAQCTDKMVNTVTPALFGRYPDPQALGQADPTDVEKLVRSTGAFRNKARNIRGCSQQLVDHHRGNVPADRDALTALPGVGRKTANVVLGTALDIPAVAVDTHVMRLSGLLRFTRHTKPDAIEQDLCKLLPPDRWARACHLLQFHGRRCCSARSPDCERCVINDLCPAAFKVGKWAKATKKKAQTKKTSKR